MAIVKIILQPAYIVLMQGIPEKKKHQIKRRIAHICRRGCCDVTCCQT